MNRLLGTILVLVLSCLPAWGGVDFDGADDTIGGATGADTRLIFDSGGTASVWVYVNSDGEADEGFVLSANNKGWEIITLGESGGAVKIRFNRWFTSTNGQWDTTSTEVTLDTWTNVIVVYDASSTTNDPTIYVDGSSVSITEQSTPAGTAEDTSDGGLVFGNNVTNGVRGYDGISTEVATWTAELSTSEIALLANSRVKRIPLDIQPASLNGYWPMDEGADGTANCFNGSAGFLDLSANARHGTGNDGSNNTGLTCQAEEVLSYPPDAIAVTKDAAAAEGGGGNVIPSGIVAEGIVIGKAKLKGSGDGG